MANNNRTDETRSSVKLEWESNSSQQAEKAAVRKKKKTKSNSHTSDDKDEEISGYSEQEKRYTASKTLKTDSSADKKVPSQASDEKDSSDIKETLKYMKEDPPLEENFIAEKLKFSTMSSVVEELTVNGALYRCWSDGKAGLVNGNGIAQGIFTVPNSVGVAGRNYDVVHIYKEAFEGNTKITGLQFNANSNIELIEEAAFFNCPNLAGTISFANCPKLKTLQKQAFSGSPKITGITFGANSAMHTVGEYAFRNCDGLEGKTVTIPDSMRNMGYYAFVNDTNRYKELLHKKIAKLTGSLPNLEVASIPLPEEAKQYESKVDSTEDKTLLHKGAKWTNEDRTTAEIRLDYGYNYDRLANLDIVFVVDNSGSMTYPTPVKDANGVLHNFPQAFLTEDILGDAAKMLLETDKSGYDNRMSLVAFGGGNTPIYKTGFLTTSTEIKDQLRKYPVTKHEMTNYNAGLQGAIDVLTAAKDPNRSQAVIFLSDGAPSDGNTGISQADKLREQGINVYPIAMYFEKEMSPQSLKDISYDKKTTYIANDTESFEKIMAEVIEDVVNHAEPLDVQIEDILSDKFEVQTGNDDLDYELSPDGGKVTRQGQKITWNLEGCAQGVAHTLKIKVKVKKGTELSATGVLATNDSMGATNGSIESEEQPQLDRYLAHHRFENDADPNASLPEEVMEILPGTKGGYGKGQRILATSIGQSEVKTKDGRTWKFVGWDEDDKTIVDRDVTFVGKWKFTGYDFSFIKLDNDGQGLQGAEFSLYAWKGINDPKDSDLAIAETIAAGKWKLLDTKDSQQNGRVDFYVPAEEGKYFQLVETKAPTSYARPQGQWRFTFDVTGYIENNQLVGIGGQNNALPPPFEVIQEGDFKGFLAVKNEAVEGQLPATGGEGLVTFTKKATTICSFGLVLCCLYLFINKKKS
ncbi:SHIRT domain-containing protein [Enterococcus sp.]|uniref:SHIRT domain-containing protein n=1 Tax=Enterococcus sp. TaxID=35783 RepID=UPI00290C3501|nr:SHIRT domain-containing protein [Enterococcus sp.]MDU5334500.1 SHIRT domain-containing protein [Enterococcus sp.]